MTTSTDRSPVTDADANLFGRAVASGGFGFILIDCDGKVLAANSPACELLGGRQDELVGTTIANLIHPDDRGWSEAELALLFAGGVDRVRQAVRLVAVDGREVGVELTVRPAHDAVSDATVGAVVMLDDARNRAQRERELRRLADTDPMTDLYNRRRFGAELDRHLALSERYGARGALLMADIDGLKRINDWHGHRAGDDAILSTATLLRTELRASDVIARIGGDEFAVLLPDCSDQEASVVARTLLNATRSRPHRDAPSARTLSIGISAVSSTRGTAAGLLDGADTAMYEVKRRGGDGYAIVGDDQVHYGSSSRLDNGRHEAERSELAGLQLVSPSVGATIDLLAVLQRVAELGSATRSQVAWELSEGEPAVAPAWSNAIRRGLLERVRQDPAEKEWMYQLTRAGQACLESLERAATAEHVHPQAAVTEQARQAPAKENRRF